MRNRISGCHIKKCSNNTFRRRKQNVLFFYSLLLNIVAIVTSKAMFTTIEMYSANNM